MLKSSLWRSKFSTLIDWFLHHTFVPRIWYLGFTLEGRRVPWLRRRICLFAIQTKFDTHIHGQYPIKSNNSHDAIAWRTSSRAVTGPTASASPARLPIYVLLRSASWALPYAAVEASPVQRASSKLPRWYRSLEPPRSPRLMPPLELLLLPRFRVRCASPGPRGHTLLSRVVVGLAAHATRI
jgi:hypothetical protein